MTHLILLFFNSTSKSNRKTVDASKKVIVIMKVISRNSVSDSTRQVDGNIVTELGGLFLGTL